MSYDSEKVKILCQQINALTDELRDMWLQQHSKRKVRQIMSSTVSQQRLLRAVCRMTGSQHPDGVSLRELAEKLCLSSSAVSVMVDNLVKRGLLERIISSEDRRKVKILISSEGEKRKEMREKFFGDISKEFFSKCDPEDMRGFEAILRDFTTFLIDKKETKNEM